MIKRKFKKLTVPAIYAFAICIFGASMYLVQKAVNKETFSTNEEMEYVDKEIVNEEVYIPVVVQTNIITKPYINEAVSINKVFYDQNAENSTQENAIIFYENTYMQNSGIAYKHNENFEVVSILDGTVIEITDNETYIYINDPNVNGVAIKMTLADYLNVWRNVSYIIE